MIFIENIFAAIFEVESEAYQAFTEIKNHMLNKNYIIPHMVLIKKEENRIIPCDDYDAKAYSNDTELGVIIGMFVGILGGPLGILLGGASGALIGGEFERELTKFKTVIHQKDAAEVAVEVAEAAALEEKFAQEAKERMK